MKNTLLIAGVVVVLISAGFAVNSPSSAVSPHRQNVTANHPAISPGEGAPMPLCQPGHNCDQTLRETAGEGAPMPLCQPGHNCDQTLRETAGEGAPMPLCQPGHNCDQTLRETAM